MVSAFDAIGLPDEAFPRAWSPIKADPPPFSITAARISATCRPIQVVMLPLVICGRTTCIALFDGLPLLCVIWLALISDKPPCVQASAPVVAGMTSWACAAPAASSRRVASLARGGGFTEWLHGSTPNRKRVPVIIPVSTAKGRIFKPSHYPAGKNLSTAQ